MNSSFAPDDEWHRARTGFEWLAGHARAVATAPHFSGRYTGTFDDHDTAIAGRWERSSDGTDWSPDFELTYTRVQ